MSSIPPPTGFHLRDVATPDCPSMSFWERKGAGVPIVCIHGNTSSKHAFAALLAEPALAGRHLVALDLPGAGESADMADPRRYTIPIVAETVAAALIAADLERPIVLGWSLGGHIAIEMAGQGAPLAALVLTGTPPAGPGAEEIASAFHPSEELGIGLTESPPREALLGYMAQVYGLEPPLPAPLVDAGFRFDGRFRARFAEHWLAGESGHPQKGVVAQWPMPIAVIQGDREPFFDAASLDRLTWHRLWRGASQMIPGAGHAPFLTHPAAYAALLAAFAGSASE